MQGNNIVSSLNIRQSITATQFSNSAIKFLNSTGVGMALAPVNMIAAYNATNSMVNGWGNMNTGQQVDAVMGTGSSYVFAGGSLYALGNGLGAASIAQTGVEGFAFAEGFGATAFNPYFLAAAGGLAIFGLVNEGTKIVSGKSIAEHGEMMEIPIYTSGIRRLNSGSKYQGAPMVRSESGMSWQIDPRWLRMREEIENGTYKRPRPKPDCPQNNSGGTQNPNGNGNPIGGTAEAISSQDPNEIIGPDGVPAKSWISINDRLPYTILFENDKTASAPAKYVKIISPAHAKMDAATFQLGSFGFNNLTFAVPPVTASYYQRLDCRDSLGLYVDITAGYDVQNNQAFWEFQSIDPVTLLPPSDPLKGFLLLQDSLNNTSGHGFVNFSIKPVTTALTLDSILARADIMFDLNDTIPTNIEKNTIDAFPPVSSISNLPDSTINTEITIAYTGTDDLNGSGVKWYSIFVSDNGAAPELYAANFRGADTTFIGVEDHLYRFYITATDSTGNKEVLKLVDSIFVKDGEHIICPNGSVSFDSKLTGSTYQWQIDTGSGFVNLTDGGVYSGTSTSVLNISNAPTSLYGYQYRCLVNGNTYSIIFLLKFGMTWEGTTSNVWENPANWSCNSLPDANTDVTINSGKPNYPQVNSNVTIRTLRMNPGATGQVNSGFTLTIVK